MKKKYIFTNLSYSILLIITCFLLLNCQKNEIVSSPIKKSSAETSSEKKLGKLTFQEKNIDLGEITYSDSIIKIPYKYKNTGITAVTIEYVNPDCTCTNYDYTKRDLQPNDSGEINLYFDTKNKIGIQKIYTIVKANTEDEFYKLVFKMNIKRNKS